jgi:hypothetical protein
MTETGDLLNAGEVVEACGRAWTFAHIGPGIRARFSRWAKGRARQGLLDERRDGTLDVTSYREEADALKQQIDAGAYNWGSPLSDDDRGVAIRALLTASAGFTLLLQLLLEGAHGLVPGADIAAILTENPDGVREAVALCLDPNRAAPTASRPAQKTRTAIGDRDSPTSTVLPSSRGWADSPAETP